MGFHPILLHALQVTTVLFGRKMALGIMAFWGPWVPNMTLGQLNKLLLLFARSADEFKKSNAVILKYRRVR